MKILNYNWSSQRWLFSTTAVTGWW